MRMELRTNWRVPVAELGWRHNPLRYCWPLTMALAASAQAVATIVSVLVMLAMALWRRGGGRWVCWRKVVPRQWRQLCGPGTRGCMRVQCDACFVEPSTGSAGLTARRQGGCAD